MPEQQQFEWDLFISYARENQIFVHKQLVEPLRRYRTADGRPVKIFVDTLSLRAGVNWMVKTTDAIYASRVLVAIYSDEYFDSETCKYELECGASRDPLGERGMFTPIALSAAEGRKVNKAYNRFNWLNATDEGWFEALTNTLGYRLPSRIQTLEFENEIAAATVGAPIPTVGVEVLDEGRRVDDPLEIRIIAESGTLRGTTTVKTQNGMAIFSDIFFDSAVESTRLVATADGCSAVFSSSFAVVPVRTVETPRGDPRIDVTGEVYFFGDPEVIGVAAGETLHVFSTAGQSIGRVAIPRLPRLLRRREAGLAFCAWDGSVVLVGSDGSRREWQLESKHGICVPGDIADGVAKDEMLVGMWSGEVWRLLANGTHELFVRHPFGVQALEAGAGVLLVSDLEGKLGVYNGQTLTLSVSTEPVIRRLKLFQDSAVLIGEQQIYEYRLDTGKIYSVGLPMSERIVTVYGLAEKTVAVSREGRGILFHREQARQTFWTAPGCLPVSTDNDAQLCVFRHPDQTYSLWHDRRPILQGVTGGLAVSRSGKQVALGEGRDIKISSTNAILNSAGGAVGAN